MMDARKIMAMTAAVGLLAGEMPRRHWEGANDRAKPARKATKDRSKIKVARKQNRSRK